MQIDGVRRPEPALGRADRLRNAVLGRVEQLRGQRELRRQASTAPLQQPDGAIFAERRSKGLLGASVFNSALIVVGSTMLLLGGLWGWQSWNQRSAEPIDNLLPVLVAADGGAGEAEEPAFDGAELGATFGEVADEVAAEPSSTAPAPVELDDPLIIVHVSGAVLRPGVVQLLDGARVFEAIDAAGGAGPLADLNRVNLAAPLRDGERIHVPRTDEDQLPVVVQPESASPSSAVANGRAPDSTSIDINAASHAELQMLPGVGPSIAQAIVSTREARGPFLSVDELLEVPGIGEAKLATIAANAVVIAP